MTDKESTTVPGPTVSQLIQELWEKELHDPLVFDDLVKRKEALQPKRRRDVRPLSGLAAVTAAISHAVHKALAGGGSRRANTLNDLDFLTGSPEALFNSIAVNKIMMEACSRSPEVEQYIRAVNARGRYNITAFENDKLLKILAALDRYESSASVPS